MDPAPRAVVGRPGIQLGDDTRGASATEYLVVVGMIAVLVLAGFRAFGGSARAKIVGQGQCVSALDPNCGKEVGAATTRHAKIEAAAEASQGDGSVQLASAGLGSHVLRVLSWLNPISSAHAAEPERGPAAAKPRPTRANAQTDGNRIADAIVAALRRSFAHAEVGQRYSPLWPRSWTQQRDMWGESWGNELPGELVQSPPASHWGTRSTDLPAADTCEGAACRDRVEQEFGMRRCESQGDCTRGTCAPVAAATRSAGGPVSLCTGHSDFLYDEVYRTIAGATRTVNFATLAAPGGAYTAAIRNALAELHDNTPPGGPGVDVRILIGRADDGTQPPGTAVAQILAELTRDLPPGSPVRVSAGTYGGPDVSRMASWSHAKLIVADGRMALVGGHNWWVGDYNRENPVHDVSVRLRGPAAQHADAYFDQLWGYALASRRIAHHGVPAAPTSPSTASPAGTPGEGVRVIAVGAPGGHFANVGANAPADLALLTMIRSARTSVRLSQQELVSQPLADQASDALGEGRGRIARRIIRRAADRALEQRISPGVLDELALAVLRGVRVEVVLTGIDPASGTTGYSHGWTTAQTHAAIAAHLRSNYPRLVRQLPPGSNRPDRSRIDELLQSGLDIRELRFSDESTVMVNGSPMPLRNHAKVVIVDDAVAYVGSQNLYPGGMGDSPPIQQLGEFGYVLVGPEVPRLMLRDYWDPMWRLARSR